MMIDKPHDSAAPISAASALSAGLGMTVEEARVNAGDALRYRWLVRYLIGPRTDLDDAIVAAKTKEEHDAILDADMMATTCIPNNRISEPCKVDHVPGNQKTR